jgi:hypothetical protein
LLQDISQPLKEADLPAGIMSVPLMRHQVLRPIYHNCSYYLLLLLLLLLFWIFYLLSPYIPENCTGLDASEGKQEFALLGGDFG